MKEKNKRKRKGSESVNENQEDESQDEITNPFSQSELSHGEPFDNSYTSREKTLAKPKTIKPATTQNCHRAGVDAFMTALSFAVFSTQLRDKGEDVMSSAKNKLYLSGKDLPLQITRGNFGKCSVNHLKATCQSV